MKISRLGETKKNMVTLKTPIYTSGATGTLEGRNWYYLKKTCLICGLPIRNASASHSVVCRDRKAKHAGNAGRNNKSICQKYHDRNNNAIARKRNKELGKKYKQVDHSKLLREKHTDIKTRKCLTCERDFESKHTANRVCNQCSHPRNFRSDLDLTKINKRLDDYMEEHGMVDTSGKSLGSLWLGD